ncbi:hypothetical protein VARIO8X_120449 [Burkholderiales bacterium 8X]|jgi:hypothetical protein|nr:hypothetical protein VARIO8X_120449 [Burkholderiales bacterium 8X]
MSRAIPALRRTDIVEHSMNMLWTCLVAFAGLAAAAVGVAGGEIADAELRFVDAATRVVSSGAFEAADQKLPAITGAMSAVVAPMQTPR